MRLTLLFVSVVVAAVCLLPSALFAQVPATTLPALKADEALWPEIEKGFSIQALRDTRDTSLVQIMIQVDRPLVGMGFDVSLTIGDRQLPVGPVAWSKDKIRWWAFDVDVPTGHSTLDVVFTPSAPSAAKLKQRDPDDLKDLNSIWTGAPIQIQTKVSDQALGGMIKEWPPSNEQARSDLNGLLAGDDAVIEKLKRGGNLAEARKELERQVKERPEDATAWFNLGCVTAATKDWQPALSSFAKTRQIDADSSLADRAQRQLRRNGGYIAFAAEREDGAAMVALATMYQRGWGPQVDRQTAKKWFRNAANAGSAAAMVQLAVMYDQDLAGGVKTPKADAWYREQIREMYRGAAELGNEEAKKWLATHDGR